MQALSVLILEDDVNFRTILKRALESFGFLVEVSDDPLALLESLKKRQPDLMFVDVFLPSMNGFEFLSAFQRLDKSNQVQIFMMSGIYYGARHREKARKIYGVQHYFKKPFEMSEVRSVLEEMHLYVPQKSIVSMSTDKYAEDIVEIVEVTAQDVAEKQALDEADFSRYFSDFSGVFEQQSFAHLLVQIYEKKLDAALYCENNRHKKIIYFEKGIPRHIRSNVIEEYFGQFLVAKRWVSQEQCSNALAYVGKENVFLGEAFVALDFLSAHQCKIALTQHFEEKFYSLFKWQTGEYHILEEVHLEQQSVLDLEFPLYVLEGIQRSCDIDDVQHRLLAYQDVQLIFRKKKPVYWQQLGLNAQEKELNRRWRAFIKEGVPLHQLKDSHLMTAQAQLFLYFLIVLGVVRLGRESVTEIRENIDEKSFLRKTKILNALDDSEFFFFTEGCSREERNIIIFEFFKYWNNEKKKARRASIDGEIKHLLNRARSILERGEGVFILKSSYRQEYKSHTMDSHGLLNTFKSYFTLSPEDSSEG